MPGVPCTGKLQNTRARWKLGLQEVRRQKRHGETRAELLRPSEGIERGHEREEGSIGSDNDQG